MNCELCDFKNPKGSATAVIIKDNKLLLMRRNEEPFKGMLDLPGGYMNAGETPKDCVMREIIEEMGIYIPQDFSTHIIDIPGEAEWKDKKFPITNHLFLVDIGNAPIILNGENTSIEWIPIKDVKPEEIAFTSNRAFCEKELPKFYIQIERAQVLIKQLDSSADFNEQRYYKALIEGIVSAIYDNDELVGLGSIFIRQTMLRKQAVVEDMIVDEKCRGKGYGKQLLLDLIEKARLKETEVIELTTNPKRIAANALYQKVGFKLHPTNHYLLPLK